MAYDEGVAQRIREAAEGQPDIDERRMFVGIAFLASDHMFVGVLGVTRVPGRHTAPDRAMTAFRKAMTQI